MSQVVYKYRLSCVGESCLMMPAGAEVLSVQAQRNDPMVWALVDPSKPSLRHWFYVAPTGSTAPLDLRKEDFVGTVQIDGGDFVYHVFDLGEVR